jgi:hypothetical protein
MAFIPSVSSQIAETGPRACGGVHDVQMAVEETESAILVAKWCRVVLQLKAVTDLF